MKKSAFNRIIIWTIVTLVLIATLVVGIIALKALSHNVFEEFSKVNVFSMENADKFVDGEATFQPSDVTSINANWFDGEIKVVYADTNEIKIEEDYDDPDAPQMCWYLENGKLELSGECTEVCQYYAFFFGIANNITHSKLLKTLIDDFGPKRAEDNKYPEIYPANAFIGNYLRLDILMQYGEYDKALENIKGYFYYMAQRTGTLWEHTGTTASCDHGFASYVICWLDKLKKLGKIQVTNYVVTFA